MRVLSQACNKFVFVRLNFVAEIFMISRQGESLPPQNTPTLEILVCLRSYEDKNNGECAQFSRFIYIGVRREKCDLCTSAKFTRVRLFTKTIVAVKERQS